MKSYFVLYLLLFPSVTVHEFSLYFPDWRHFSRRGVCLQSNFFFSMQGLFYMWIIFSTVYNHFAFPWSVTVTLTVSHTCSLVVCHRTPMHKAIFNRATIRTLYMCCSHNHISLLDTGNISSNTREVSEVCTTVRECFFVFLSDSVFCLNEKIRLCLWNRCGIKNVCIPTAGPCYPDFGRYRQINVVSSWWLGCSDIDSIKFNLLLSRSKSEIRNLWLK